MIQRLIITLFYSDVFNKIKDEQLENDIKVANLFVSAEEIIENNEKRLEANYKYLGLCRSN
jgi:hypothetical protein